MQRFSYIIILALLIPQTLFSQPKVKTWLSDDTVHFAQSVVLNIEITTAKNAAVKFPKLKYKQLSPNLVVSQVEIDTVIKSQNQTLNLKLTLIPFKDTVLTIPSIPLSIDNQNFSTDSLSLVVLPIEKDSTQLAQIDTSQVIDIFDVTKPLSAPLTLKELWLRFRYYLLGLLALLLLAYLLYRLYLIYKKHKEQKQLPVEQQIPPYELALQRLNALKQKKLYQQGKFKEFYSELSEIIRQYIELSYNISALELTTSELEALLQHSQLFDEQLKNGLLTILKNADLVKFAKYKPLPTICESDLQFAFDFVEKTKPQPEPEEEDEALNNEQKTENQQQ